MTTIAIFKWAMDPHDERVGVDGNVKWSANKPVAGDDDHEVVKVALDIAGEGEVVGMTMAGGDTAFAAARGAKRTIAIEGVDALAQPVELAGALAAAVRAQEGVDAVVVGDSAWEPMVPSLLASMLGWPCVLAADGARREGDALVVTRRFGAGTQDVQVDSPAVIAVAARREEESKPGMRAVLAARKLPVEKIAGSAEGFAHMDSQGTHAPESAPARIFDGTNPEAAVERLVAALKAEGVL